MVGFKFNPEIKLSWGVYRCKCGSEYYDSNEPVHKPGCPGNENGGVTYFFGLREVEEVLLSCNGRSRCGRLTLTVLVSEIDKWPLEVQRKIRDRKRSS